MDILLLVLAVFGAIGGVVLVWNSIKKHSRTRLARREAKSSTMDFQFESLVFRGRWIRNSREFNTFRQATIRSGIEGLSSNRIGVGPVSDATFDVEIITEGFKLEKIPAQSTDKIWELYDVVFPKTLKKDELITYEVKEDAKAKRGKTLPTCLTYSTDRRLDYLELRMTFEKDIPSAIFFRERLVSREIVTEELLTPDLASFEVFKIIRLCKPRHTYALEWENE